jgi:hypothetical protein
MRTRAVQVEPTAPSHASRERNSREIGSCRSIDTGWISIPFSSANDARKGPGSDATGACQSLAANNAARREPIDPIDCGKETPKQSYPTIRHGTEFWASRHFNRTAD